MPQFGTELWHRRATSLELAVEILLCLVVGQSFYFFIFLFFILFDMHLNWQPKRPIATGFEC